MIKAERDAYDNITQGGQIGDQLLPFPSPTEAIGQEARDFTGAIFSSVTSLCPVCVATYYRYHG